MEWPEFTTTTKQLPLAAGPSPSKAVLRYRVRPLGDFVNVKGKLTSLYGCAFAELDMFLDRVEYLHSLVRSANDALSFDEVLAGDTVAREYVEWCLGTHGLTIGDVSLRHVQDLLFYEAVDGELRPGLLLRINQPRTVEQANDETMTSLGVDIEQAKYERAVAILSTHTGSVEEAVSLTHMLTAQQITDIMAQKSDVTKSANSGASELDKAKAMATLDRALEQASMEQT